MVQTRSSSSKEHTTHTNIGMSLDAAESSRKNTLNKKKRTQPTAEESEESEEEEFFKSLPPQEAFGLSESTDEDHAQTAFMVEYTKDYFKKHPDVRGLIPFEEREKGLQKFFELVNKEGSEFVNKYAKMYVDEPQGKFSKVNLCKSKLIEECEESEEEEFFKTLPPQEAFGLRGSTDEDHAQTAVEYTKDYFKKHPNVRGLIPFVEREKGLQKFFELVNKEGSEFVNKYAKLYVDEPQGKFSEVNLGKELSEFVKIVQI